MKNSAHLSRRRRLAFEPLEQRALLASQGYNWQNAPIGGGGFVTGIVFSPTVPNLVYARTDVGGAYRWDQAAGDWTPLTDFITYFEHVGIEPDDWNY
jgi:hypothetical protein